MANTSRVENGPNAGMYTLRPYYDVDEKIDAPNCMYKLNSIYHSNYSVAASTSQASHNTCGSDDSLETLERRQKDILVRLGALQKKVTDLVAKHTATESVANQLSIKGKQSSSSVKTVNDIVITANPRSPPLSVFILARMLADQCHVLLTTYVHSSARALVGPHLINAFETNREMVTDRNSFSLGITVIWKDEHSEPTLIVKPGQQVPIRGEANIARYLGRLLVKRYDVDNVIATQIDSALDKAADLLRSDSVQSSNIITSISALLSGSGKSKSGWIYGFEHHSLADAVVWSAVNQRCAKNLPNDVSQWVSRCNQLPEYSYATSLLK